MHRFYLPPPQWRPGALTLDHAESHHATSVMRLDVGERIVIFNGQGLEATGEIVSTERGIVTMQPQAQQQTAPLSCAITLGQAVPKGKNMEFILEKATELGASAIQPLLSDRTIARTGEGDDASKKQLKWQRTVIEAAKQCGQNWIPRVAPARTMKAFMEQPGAFDLMLVASLQPDARPIKETLAAFPGGKPARVLVLVGPEGDFTPAEMSQAKAAGCRPVTLGPIILRVETAALYCLSVLGHELFG